MIIQAVVVSVSRGWGDSLTIAEIAQKLKVTPSTKLRIMVNEMVVEGLLQSRHEKHPGIAGFRVLYSIPQEKLTKAVKDAQQQAWGKPRQIRINSAQGSFWNEI